MFSVFSLCSQFERSLKAAQSPGQKQTALKQAHETLRRTYSHEAESFSYFFEPAFEQAISRYDIPKHLFENYVEGLVLDAYFRQPQSEEELFSYASNRGGSYAKILSHILGDPRDLEDAAQALGVGLSLTRIIAGLKNDLLAGRNYLPLNWIEEVGLTSDDFKKLSLSQNIDKKALQKIWTLKSQLVGLADDQYQKAFRAIKLLPPDGSRFSIAIVTLMYARVLRKIRRMGPLSFQSQPKLGLLEKLWLLPKAYGVK